ncbi:MAG: hypothetical protein H6612_07575 [Ignavibacteriales bacterium]|nr:hypothetical protein [Ignavibacteriales bacterium]MCB9259205.1 hypothetical protein [Ignavibacteriales bacterium]
MNSKFRYYILLIFSLLIIVSCNEAINDNLLDNNKPETHLFIYSDSEVSQQKSRLQVHWWGDDKDGLVIGYLFKWDGIENQWHFTTSNDSVFALPIGTVDTSYTFYVSSVDNSGNGIFDSEVYIGQENIGHEPFTDLNNNSVYDKGEPFFDFGAIDESPAFQKFPIKNSSPEITWNDLSILPEVSFPVMTVGWNAFDLDGNETIKEIHLALNDTSDFIVLSGSTRLVSLIVNDLNSQNPEMNVYINADENKLQDDKLKNLRLNDNNRLYIRGVDISGSKSEFLPLPDTSRSWYISKPKGELLIVDDFESGETAAEFYTARFNEFINDYDVIDLENISLPYESITFQNTLKLFKFIFWYSGSNPSIDLTNLVTQNYLQNGGKIAYSMTFQDSSANFDFSTQIAQTFLPIESFDSQKPISFMFAGANIIPSLEFSNYPSLENQTTVGFVRTFKVSEITASKVYDLTSSQINGSIALLNKTKNLFFIGLPLHQCDAKSSAGNLLKQVFVNEFGLN